VKLLDPKNLQPKEIKNILFDWGGVLINIDYHATTEAFKQLGVDNFDAYYSQAKQNDIFDNLETGKLSPAEFCNNLRKELDCSLSDEEIKRAWCAMLFDIPTKRIELLKKLKKNYRIFLLSNTNLIHEQMIVPSLNKALGFEFFSLFEQVYLSHRLGMRKPNANIFLHVLKQNNLDLEETLFIDDSEQHIDGAASIGIKAFFLQPKMETAEIFKKWVE
jgi:putative hydrolase of the HAD superfamily